MTSMPQLCRYVGRKSLMERISIKWLSMCFNVITVWSLLKICYASNEKKTTSAEWPIAYVHIGHIIVYHWNFVAVLLNSIHCARQHNNAHILDALHSTGCCSAEHSPFKWNCILCCKMKRKSKFIVVLCVCFNGHLIVFYRTFVYAPQRS